MKQFPNQTYESSSLWPSLLILCFRTVWDQDTLWLYLPCSSISTYIQSAGSLCTGRLIQMLYCLNSNKSRKQKNPSKQHFSLLDRWIDQHSVLESLNHSEQGYVKDDNFGQLTISFDFFPRFTIIIHLKWTLWCVNEFGVILYVDMMKDPCQSNWK